MSVVEATRVGTEVVLESSRRHHDEQRRNVETSPSKACFSCRRMRHGSTTRSSSGSSSGVGDLAVSLMQYGIRAKGCRRIRSFLLGARSVESSYGAVRVCPSGSFGVGALRKGSSRGGTSFILKNNLVGVSVLCRHLLVRSKTFSGSLVLAQAPMPDPSGQNCKFASHLLRLNWWSAGNAVVREWLMAGLV